MEGAHHQCSADEQTVVSNAQALAASGLAEKDIVTVDDCWTTSRGEAGDLVADPDKSPHGMAWLGTQVHEMGFRFGIREDAGATTCAGFARSGRPQGSGTDLFAQDAKRFVSWTRRLQRLDLAR
ncbi:MAG TPA: hypothetical protein VMK12_32065 [Anaeromyxobacteraceae bacterium]|nr:hypothetical protein [Anaeromyxobacteraceae bacterium]